MKASGMCGSDLHPYRAAGNAAAALGLGAGGRSSRDTSRAAWSPPSAWASITPSSASA